jgi:2-iminoacetate synthase
MEYSSVKDWVRSVVKPEENYKYLQSGRDFVDDDAIEAALRNNRKSSKQEIREIIQKALDIKPLTLDETAKLIFVEDPELWNEINEAAITIKRKVYDNRIVFLLLCIAPTTV